MSGILLFLSPLVALFPVGVSHVRLVARGFSPFFFVCCWLCVWCCFLFLVSLTCCCLLLFCVFVIVLGDPGRKGLSLLLRTVLVSPSVRSFVVSVVARAPSCF